VGASVVVIAANDVSRGRRGGGGPQGGGVFDEAEVVEELAAAGLPAVEQGGEAGIAVCGVFERIAVEGEGQSAVVADLAPGEAAGERGREALEIADFVHGGLFTAWEDDVSIGGHADGPFLRHRRDGSG